MNEKELQMMQNMDLGTKVMKSKLRIRQWYNHFTGNVYVAFSGGKDSTVLLDLVRQEFPDVPAVFVQTGLQYPEVREFVKTVDNVITIKPKMTFKEIIEEHGYPIPTKMQAQYIEQYRNTGSNKLKKLRWEGEEKYGNYKISEQWKFLVDAPFKISDKCCNYMKKEPLKRYQKETGNKPFIGTMATDSGMRKQYALKNGCNAYDGDNPISKPLTIWNENDVWEYIKKYNLDYSSIYDMEYKRTGCMFCLFGAHLEKPNRFQLMKKTHPKIYNYCMKNIGLKKVIEYVNENAPNNKCKIPIKHRQLNLFSNIKTG
jgi:3'-phosphoadenosine 5'-phosphosulfate sulfotransferase (PAPS reductase)/FAD synthetase